MNPAFKSKYDQMRESKPTATEGEASAATDNGNNYLEAGHIRNLCFIWSDGKMKFLNYSYLVSSEYLPKDNCIILEFTTDTAKVIGYHLEGLFQLIMLQLAMRIVCTDARYNDLSDTGKPIVNEIVISKNSL